MRNLLLSCTAATALLGTMAIASAQEVDIKSVGLDPSYGTWTVYLSGGTAGARDEAAGMILLTTTSGSIMPVFCVDVFHTITLGSYSPPLPYTFAPLTHDSNGPVGGGNVLPVGVPYEIQALANLGLHDWKTNPGNGDALAALQGAVWQIEYGGSVTSGNGIMDAMISADVLWAGANPASVAYALYPIGPDGQGFGVTQGFGPGIPEPSTWAMMTLGFASLGYAAMRRASKASVSAFAA
jgi:hypothetical protein